MAIIGAAALHLSALQTQDIVVSYQEEMMPSPEMSRQLDDPRIAALVEQQLKQMGKTMQLYHHQGQSVYVAGSGSGQANKEATRFSHAGVTFKDLSGKEAVSQEDILDRTFLVTQAMEEKAWKITEEEKEVAGYPCRKATLEDVTAWYAPELTISDGPGMYYGLPGMILEVETPSKQIRAIEVEFPEAGVQDKVNRPSKGKRISREEFDALKQQKMEELQNSGGAVKVIKL